MKISTPAALGLLTATAKASPTSGSFYMIYLDASYGGQDGPVQVNQWWINSHLPTCHTLETGETFQDRDDVSGDKQGVRLKGTIQDPIEIELNIPLGHGTIYKNRDYKLVNLADHVIGSAALDDEIRITCPTVNGQVSASSVVVVTLL